MTGQYNISIEGKDPKNPASDEGGGKLTKEAEAAQEVHIISQTSEAAGSTGLMDLHRSNKEVRSNKFYSLSAQVAMPGSVHIKNILIMASPLHVLSA